MSDFGNGLKACVGGWGFWREIIESRLVKQALEENFSKVCHQRAVFTIKYQTSQCHAQPSEYREMIYRYAIIASLRHFQNIVITIFLKMSHDIKYEVCTQKYL